jgi:Ricin-type beta-trefoil lectin domain
MKNIVLRWMVYFVTLMLVLALGTQSVTTGATTITDKGPAPTYSALGSEANTDYIPKAPFQSDSLTATAAEPTMPYPGLQSLSQPDMAVESIQEAPSAKSGKTSSSSTLSPRIMRTVKRTEVALERRAIQAESEDPVPSQIVQIADAAMKITGYFSTAKTAFDTVRTLGVVLGLIKPDDANAKFKALHDHLDRVAGGVSWQATMNHIAPLRAQAIRAIRNLKRDGTAMRGSNEDQDSGNAAETLSDLTYGIGAFYRPYDKKVTAGRWTKAIKYDKKELLLRPGDMVYDWRLGIPALVEVISYRLQLIAAMEPNFRNNDLYDEELENYQSSLKWHLATMQNGIKCGVALKPFSNPATPRNVIQIPDYYACADIRTGIEAIEFSTWKPEWKPFIEPPPPHPDRAPFLNRLRVEVMGKMPLFEMRAMINNLYLYQHPSLDLTEKYQQIPVSQVPHFCLEAEEIEEFREGDISYGVQAGSPIWLWECNGGDAQKWVYDRRDGTIKNPLTGLCLDVQWGSGVPATPVWLWECNGGDAQKWTYDPETHVLENALGTRLTIQLRWQRSFPLPKPPKPRDLEAGTSVWTEWPFFFGSWLQQWQADQEMGPAAQGDDMQPGEVLNPGESISSASGEYTFMFQHDGNLVLYRNKDGRPLWASGTYGKPSAVCIMQDDGNLVIYDLGERPIWSSDTWRDPGSRLLVQDDGNVVIYRPDNTPVWATNTWQAPEPE